MMKKTYTQPTQKIVVLKSRAHILAGSDYKVNSYKNTDATTVGDIDEDTDDDTDATTVRGLWEGI